MDQSFSLFLSVRTSILALILRWNKSARAACRGYFASFQTKMPGANFRRPKWCNFGMCAHLAFFCVDLRPFYTFFAMCFCIFCSFSWRKRKPQVTSKSALIDKNCWRGYKIPVCSAYRGVVPKFIPDKFLGSKIFRNKLPFPKKGTAPRHTWSTQNIQNQFWDHGSKHLWVKFQWPRSRLSACKSPTNSARRKPLKPINPSWNLWNLWIWPGFLVWWVNNPLTDY